MEANNKKEQVLEKVRKLITLAEDPSASEGEVENALKMAQRLMIKHEIEESELELSKEDISEDWIADDRQKYERRFICWDVLDAISKAYNVKVIKNQRGDEVKYRIIGDKLSRKIVIETFQKIMPFIRLLAKQRYEEYKKGSLPKDIMLIDFILGSQKKLSWLNFMKNYMAGYVDGLELKLKKDIQSNNYTDEEREKWGLIVVKKDALIKEYVENTIPNLKSSSSSFNPTNNLAIMTLGRKDGEEQNASNRLEC